MQMLDLFSGIGGFSLAASWTNAIDTVAFCEIEPYCQKVLKKHWPDTPIYADIKQLRGEDIVRKHGAIDIVCGGFPCQPFSTAGRSYTKGRNDDRYLWPEMLRVIQETQPTWVVGENVVNFGKMELDNALHDLEVAGYEVITFNISAFCVGAKHPRQRLWIVCHTGSESMRKTSKQAVPIGTSRQTWRNHRAINRTPFPQPNWQENPSRILRVANGLSSDMDRRRALGNAIVPQVAYPIFDAIVKIENGVVCNA